MDKSGIRILIVDDDAMMLRSTTRVLEGAGYEVTTESSGQAALARMHELRPDLVLLDRHLPDLNGVEVCRHIKQDPTLAEIFVVFLSTVYTDSDEQSEGLESGADGYIARPIPNRELVARIDAFVRILHLNRKLREQTLALVESEDRYRMLLLGIGQDITERKRAEADLRESEERLRLALRAAHQGLFDLNVQTSEVIVNDGYALMLGYDPATFTETNESWRRRLHPEDRDRTSQAYRDYIEGRTSEYRVEFRLRTKRGDWKWILSLGKLVAWDDAGRPLRMLGTHTDISEQKRAEETREQLRRQERLAAIGQLAAGIAHDFNNMMAVIVLYAQMVTAQSELLPETRARVRVIEEQAYRATELIGQILDFSRRAQLARRPMQIQPLLKEMVKLWRRTLPETISVTLDLPGGGCWVHADPTRIQQVLMNLATNARDAMSGGGEIHIRLREQTFADETDIPLPSLSRGAWVRLEFADTGDGMSDEVRAHLFEPFFTTKAPGEGTGLGLAQIHGIVKQHGGDITVATSLGQGTTFTIFLPARPPPTMDRTAASESEVRMTGSGQRVLVVEDNAMTRQALTDSLMALGYRPIPAAHGREALALLAADGEAPVELIVSDLTMPEMGGQVLVSKLRDRGDRIPVLILTGHIRDEEVSSLEAMGGVRCLHKPVEMSQLASSLAELLRGAPGT